MKTTEEGAFPSVEQIEAHSSQELMSVNLTRGSWSRRIAALFVAGLFTVLLLAIAFLPWVQTVQGYGRVIAYSPNDREQNIEATVEGQIVTWYVTEGSRVKKGEPIVEISDIDPNFMERIQTERQAALSKLNAAQKSLEASQRNLERQRELFRKGLSSRRAFELAEIEEAKFLGDVASAAAELAKVETRLARQASQKVAAPRDGIIQHILALSGGIFVKPGDLLATIVPDTESRAVEIFIDGNDLPIVDVGRVARLQFEGWPAIQFSGWPSMAIGTFEGRVSLIDPSDNGMGKFRILVTPTGDTRWPESHYLRQGVRAVAWVNLDTVRLWWELWRRFNAFPILPRGATPAEGKKQGVTRSLNTPDDEKK